MNRILSNKKIVASLILFIVILIVGSVILNNHFSPKKMSNIEYRTDSQPLIDRFGEIISIESCFWKADVFSKRGIGPSSYWMKGFIVTNQSTLDQIKSQYKFEPISLSFEKGLEPTITGINDFNWYYSKEFSSSITKTKFIGDFYLDIKNGVIYFDLENN
jgi:hypothetical protein